MRSFAALLMCGALLGVAHAGALPLELCYSPTQAGCEKCCRATSIGAEIYTWTGDDPNQPPVTPWYNAVEAAGACEEVQPCADCSARNMEEYQSLIETGPPEGCLCGEGAPTQVDACYAPKSCECYCETFERVQTCEALLASGAELGPLGRK